MRDADAAIRKSFYQALATHITYESVAIPVFDEKIEGPVEKDIWVVIADQSDEDSSTKHNWASTTTIDINIFGKRKGTGGKKIIEGISDQILQIVNPTINTIGLTIDSPFKIVYCYPLSGRANALTQDSANQFVHIKTLQFKIFINQ